MKYELIWRVAGKAYRQAAWYGNDEVATLHAELDCRAEVDGVLVWPSWVIVRRGRRTVLET